MTQEERDKITAFVASMGFEKTWDLKALSWEIESVILRQRVLAKARAEREAAEWAPGGWRREPAP